VSYIPCKIVGIVAAVDMIKTHLIETYICSRIETDKQLFGFFTKLFFWNMQS